MICVSFFTAVGELFAFDISGHSDYSDAGTDIVCSAVSAMAMLTINTVTDIYGCSAETVCEEDEAHISFRIGKTGEPKEAYGLVKGFYMELKELEKSYPEFVRVKMMHTV